MQVVGFTLRGAGHDVIEAVDGVGAKKKVESRVKMVITDLNMPNTDGIALIRALRSEPVYKFIPTVMLTTESPAGLLDKGRFHG